MPKLTCTVEGLHLKPCDTLAATVEGTHTRKRRGIHVWAFSNNKTGEPTRTFIGVRSGEHTEKGLAFIFCPFCGTRIDGPYKEFIE